MITIKEYTEEVVKAITKKLKLDSFQRLDLLKEVRNLENYKTYRNKIVSPTVKYNPNKNRKSSTLINLYSLIEVDRKLVEDAVRISHLDIDKFVINSREGEYVDCRRMIMAVMRIHLGYSLTKVGKLFNKDHSSIIHNVRKHNDFMVTDKVYSKRFEKYLDCIKESNPGFM
jgi:chromosomal replication initiation ATPase DnaA